MDRNAARKGSMGKVVGTIAAILIGVLLAMVVITPVKAQEDTSTPPVQTPLPPPDDPTKWDLPETAVENVENRTRDSKEFSNGDGSLTSILSPNLHYEESPGVWQNSDNTFVFNGTDAVMETHPMYHSRVSNEGVSIITPDTGKGITWHTSHRPSIHFDQYVDGQYKADKASFMHDGLVWTDKNTNYGVKSSAIVTAPRGFQTYSFRYSLVGNAYPPTVDDYGNIIGDGFTVPRSLIIGANRVRYDASHWTLRSGYAEFTFDDSILPPEAYPYEVDPTTTTLQRGNTTVTDAIIYSANPTTNYGTATYLMLGDQSGTADTSTRDVIYFDTSSISAASTVTSATFSAYMYGAASNAGDGSQATTMRRLLRNWNESQVTWNVYSSGNSWTTAGAGSDGNDRIAAISATRSHNNSGGAAGAYVDWTGSTLTTDVQNFVDGGYTNYGWLLTCGCEARGASAYSFAEYYSSDYGSQSYRPKLVVVHTNPSAAVTGTVGDGATEQEVRAGDGTVIITLTDDTWVAAGGTFDGQRQNIIDGLDSAQSETYGWNAEVRDKMAVGSVIRTSDTVVTITISASDVAAYRITSAETITVTVPSSSVASGTTLTATPTFAISANAESAATTGTLSDDGTTAEVIAGGQTVIITLTNTTWVAAGSTFNAQRQNIIDGMVSGSSDTFGWNAIRSSFAVGDVVRTSDTVVTITLSAASTYAILATETITVTVPASAIVYAAAIVSPPTFDISPRFVASGTWVSPAINLSPITVLGYCAVGWSQTTPAGTSVVVEYSTNGGSDYSTATNGSCPLTIGDNISSITDFRIRASLTRTTDTTTPQVDALGVIFGDENGQTVRYQLNDTPALTILDRTGNGYTGTMSFPSQPSGLDTTVGSMTALRDPTTAQINLGIPQFTSPVTGSAVSANLFNLDETGWAELPGYSIINSMSTAGDGLPIQFVWYIFLGFLIIMGGFFALNLTNSLFASAATMGVGIGAALAIGGGLMPGWVIFVFLPIAIGLVFLRPRLAI
jgi:hypothetical protein